MVKIKPLLWYITFISLLGLFAFLYRSVFSAWLVKKYRYEVAELNQLTPSVLELVLRPKGLPIHYQAGQFAFLSFESQGIDPEPHPYSFSNHHNGPYVRFTIKSLGDDTKALQKLKKGTKAYLEGPFGTFNFRRVNNRKQVWIAGGIGITPFLSMARSFSGRSSYDIRFFYGTESLDDAVFLQEFIDITRHVPENFKTSVVSKDIHGFVTIELLKKSLGDLQEYDFMLCGPPPMINALRTQLKESGMPNDQLHIEDFSF